MARYESISKAPSDYFSMNILVVSNCPLDANQGSGYVICGFAEGLKARGHHVKAFGPEDFIFIPKARPAKRLRLFIGFTLKAITEAWNYKSSYDIIELWGGVGWLSCLILTRFRLSSYQVISRSNGLEPNYRFATITPNSNSYLRSLFCIFENWTDKIGFQSADTLTVVSKYDEVFAIKNSYQETSRLLLLENALSNSWLSQKISHKDNCVIGFVGGWYDRKGNKQLIDVINRLSAMGSTCKWMIVGVGKEGKKELLENTRLPSSSIYDQLPRVELQKLYKQLTVLLCLSSYESFGLMCSEAMSCGCMLMSTKVGFASGLGDGIDYVSINRYNISVISTKLLQIENGSINHELIAKSGYQRVQSLQWHPNIIRLEKHYMNLIVDNQ